ncbi:MAG: substrate-binding domain-containing protein [Coprococcus sp.]
MLWLRNRHPEMKEALHVGVVTYTQGDPFINAMTDNLKENLKSMETEDMKIIVSVKNGKDDQQAQNETVEEMIDAGCDVLCINLVDRTVPSRIIKLAKQNHIPVIFFNREPVRARICFNGKNCIMSVVMQSSPALWRERLQQTILRIIRKSIRIRTAKFNMCCWKVRPDIRIQSAERIIR